MQNGFWFYLENWYEYLLEFNNFFKVFKTFKRNVANHSTTLDTPLNEDLYGNMPFTAASLISGGDQLMNCPNKGQITNVTDTPPTSS